MDENENNVFADPASLDDCSLGSLDCDNLFDYTGDPSCEDSFCYTRSSASSSSVKPEETSSVAEPPEETVETRSETEPQEPVAKPKRKRENRYKNAPPSVISRRRAQNRASQRAYRERKDQRIKDLELIIREGEIKQQALLQQIELLKAANAMLTGDLLKTSRQFQALQYWLTGGIPQQQQQQRATASTSFNYSQQGGPQQYQE
ncbi:hypothetical protein F5B17DRAFT_421110 [Nemania serpens]|nr:hypothetical protein F5B17DRAFT_421110 [Nemania serpens]